MAIAKKGDAPVKARLIRTLPLVLLGILLLWTAVAFAQPESYGLPARLTSLTDLGPVLQRKDLTAAQRTDVLVSWLTRERAHPSGTVRGLGGGDIDSGYLQAQLIKALAEAGDARAVAGVAASTTLADDGLRDAARIVLGMMGDRQQVSSLLVVLATHKEADFRALAAVALGRVGAVEAIPALEAAREDGATRRASNCTRGSHTSYPVREAATSALRVLRSPDALARAKLRTDRFASRQKPQP
jgi:hypothetical protein